MSETDYTLSPIGFLSSPLKSREEAPNQGYEGVPDAWLEVNETVAEGLEGNVFIAPYGHETAPCPGQAARYRH